MSYHSHWHRREGETGVRNGAEYRRAGVYGADKLLIILLILSMCVADAFLTLTLLSRGGHELNPLVKILIDHDATLFFIFKYIVTACSLLILLIHNKRRLLGYVSGTHILVAVLVGYTLLVTYELALLRVIGAPGLA